MSQFDFPRLNFYGQAVMDVPTANNGNYEQMPNGKGGLTMFDQDNSEVFMPPRCYLNPGYTYVPPAGSGIVIQTDANGNTYVPLTPITIDHYQDWAITPLGTYKYDQEYNSLYSYLGLTGKNPGYWSYFGDLSLSLVDVGIQGITLPNPSGIGTDTYTSENIQNAPPEFIPILGSILSFNNDYFSPGSRTTAYLCDVDSIGQTCTQFFYGTSGLYTKDNQGNPVTFFQGTPGKSTARWMNLFRVLNYSDMSLLPMGGSACFYSTIQLQPGSQIAAIFEQYTGQPVTALFMKLNIHEVYEVRNPDYTQVPTQSVFSAFGNQANVPKNPAIVGVSGSITPWMPGDMTTTSICRIMKNYSPVTINPAGIPLPVTKGGTTLSVPASVYMAPIQLLHDPEYNIISLDLFNAINEYGYNPGTIANYAGSGDIPPFTQFENYDYGQMTLWWMPDGSQTSVFIGSFDHAGNYNFATFTASGGMIDFAVAPGADYTGGYFYLTINEGTTIIYQENNIYITSDQNGIYGDENQPDYLYMSDGLPKVPCILRVFNRGVPVSYVEPVNVTLQNIDMRTNAFTNTPITIWDNIQAQLPNDQDGCITYNYVDSQSILFSASLTFPQITQWFAGAYFVVLRTLSEEPQLQPYLNGQTPITWDVVYSEIFSLYEALYPVMSYVVPFTPANWSNPFILNKMLQLMDLSNWNKPLYMPVTRDLTAPQRQLLQMWAAQNMSSQQNTKSNA